MKRIFKKMDEHYKNYRKNRANSRRFRAYYSQRKEDTRSNIAKVVDYVLWRIILFFIVLLLISIRSVSLPMATLIAALALMLFHLISIKLRNNKLALFKNEKRRQVANQKVYKEIMNKTSDELKEYIEAIFTKRGFYDLKYIDHDHRSILMEGYHLGDQVMIQFYLHKNDYDVELKDIKEFTCKLVEYEVIKGVILTTSDFTQDSYSFAQQMNKKYRIILLNRDKLMEIIEVNEMLPSDEEIDEIIENQISKREKKWQKYKEVALSDKKIKGYIALGIYLIIAAFYIPYTAYYIVVASITFLMAGISIYYYIKNNIYDESSENQKKEDLFEGS